MTMKASGGFVDSGDLFIANENGVPEMIGRFGNQTAVANTDQIVAGISNSFYMSGGDITCSTYQCKILHIFFLFINVLK